MFKRILIPIDGSKAANLALSKAITLCKNQKARLLIVHSIDYMKLAIGVEGVDAVTLHKGLKKTGKKMLEKAQKLAEKRKVKAETRLIESLKLTSRIDNKVVKEAKRWRADLIVLGTHKKHGIKHLIFGSEAENIMHKTKIPILLFRAEK
ncbi:MAG: universal stress protein [Gammaproteobacteria bacterium]|jgi:nucleotide-binding universal stress UspA family protein|nr:universal stress protein [Gammaproteobacteria bacterium]